MMDATRARRTRVWSSFRPGSISARGTERSTQRHRAVGDEGKSEGNGGTGGNACDGANFFKWPPHLTIFNGNTNPAVFKSNSSVAAVGDDGKGSNSSKGGTVAAAGPRAAAS